MSHIEADIDFLEALVERDGKSEHARAVEFESDEADEDLACEEVELGARGN